MDACVLHLIRYERNGRGVTWDHFAVYEGACEGVYPVQLCSVHLIMTVLFPVRWSNPEYMRDFYWAVLNKEYGKALNPPRSPEDQFTLLHFPGACAVVNNKKARIPTVEEIEAVAQKGLAEVMSWLSSKG
jgi:hypothetical protein